MEAGRSGEFTVAQRYLDEAELEKSPGSREQEAALAFQRTLQAKWLGDLEGTMRWAAEAARVSSESRGVTDPYLWLHPGEALLESGRYAEARDVLLPAAASFDERRDRNGIPEAHARLARAYVGLGELRRARECVTRAQREVLPEDYEAQGAVGVAAAELSAAERNPDEAERIYRETIVMVDRFGATWIGLAKTCFFFAGFLVRQQRFAEARDLLVKARDFYRDPLAARRREQINALLAQCEVAAS